MPKPGLIPGDDDSSALGVRAADSCHGRPIGAAPPSGSTPSARSNPPRSPASDDTDPVAALCGLQARADAALANSSELIMFFSADGLIRFASPACRQILGMNPEELVNRNWVGLVHPDDQAAVVDALSSMPNHGNQARFGFRVIDTAGGVRWVEEIATNLVDDPRIGCFVANIRDVTDAQAAKLGSVEQTPETGEMKPVGGLAADGLARQASHDWLTQLPNWTGLHDYMQAAMDHTTPPHRVAVALLDIDRFKLVNERSGHAGGDEALQVVAARLRAGFRSNDVVARMGGNEFAIVSTDVTTLAQAEKLGERAMDLLREPVVISDRELQLTISVGVALSTAVDSATSLLVDAADAMHQAKRDGKNCLAVYDDTARARAHRRRTVSIALPLALQRDELHLEYQPILELGSLRTVGFEALLRWEHPDLGEISPIEFIPIAEDSGLILPIGSFVLDRAARQLAAWRADRRMPTELWMAVNVSAPQLAQSHFADEVAATLERSAVPASSIHLEITESVLMERVDDVLRTIVDLRAVGVNVSIDDFGTGYSSLSYLSRLPVDTLKIDRSFIGGLGATAHGTSIIRAMVTLAKILGLAVVAEGVELPSQVDLLRELGCTHAQGFIWSHPLRPGAAADWLVERKTLLDSSEQAEPSTSHPSIADEPYDLGRAIVEIAQATGVRRRTSDDRENVLRFDSLEIGLNTRRAWLAGRDLDLTAKEFELLAFMAENTGKVFSRGELLHEVWNSSPDWQNPATVTEHIHRLRRSIEPDPSRPRLISTVRGRGYRFGSEFIQITPDEYPSLSSSDE